jgi:DNA-binding XRE family transcriptional regulator
MRRETPNHLDPLSEPTIVRRIWAAYLKAGHTRASFAREIDVSYQTLDRWDTGEVLPSLEHVMLVASKLGYTVDQLCYGHRAPAQSSVDQVLAKILGRLEKLEQQIHGLRVSEYERTVAMAHNSLRALREQRRPERRAWIVVVNREVEFQGIMAECR